MSTGVLNSSYVHLEKSLENSSQRALHVGQQMSYTDAMEAKPCLIDGCPKFGAVRGLCWRHYRRWYRFGEYADIIQAAWGWRREEPRHRRNGGETLPRFKAGSETSPTELGHVLGVSRQRGHQLLTLQKGRARAKLNEALA
jgi:hypothetical protein